MNITEEVDKLLEKYSNKEIAEELGIKAYQVEFRRLELENEKKEAKQKENLEKTRARAKKQRVINRKHYLKKKESSSL